jgi:nitrate reductase delta subunit
MRPVAARSAHRHHLGCSHSHADPDGADRVRIAALARVRFRLEERISIRVEERATTIPGFPPRETCISFWTGNEDEHRYRVFKPAREVTDDDLPPWWMRDALIVDPFPYCDCCG